MSPINVHPSGSSPRGRGKLHAVPMSIPPARLIPAWAGKTSQCDTQHILTAAHPRVGGENAQATPRATTPSGSSPRGRGKLSQWPRSSGPQRLIPAWAGKTRTAGGQPCPSRAHPRVGGENQFTRCQLDKPRGSSPRGRGKPTWQTAPSGASRLIPAWAGKTRGYQRDSKPPTAHPRVGGENLSNVLRGAVGCGSSPRGRGKRSLQAVIPVLDRLIPAWAGKTCESGGCDSQRWAHPRVGGENTS